MSFYPGRNPAGPVQFRFGGPMTPVLKGFMIACAVGFGVPFFWRAWGGRAPLELYLGLYAPYFWRGAIWQLATFHFLHANMWHLGFNLLAMYMFAGELEQLWGRRKFIAYLIVVGLGAGLCQLASAPLLDVPVIGCSGIVYGVLLAFGLTYPNRIVLVFFILPMRVKWLVVIMGVMELSMAFDQTGQINVAHFAHLGGMLFGYLFLRWDGLYFRLRAGYYRRKLEKRRKKSNIYVVRGDDDEPPPPYVH
jgi:membrane associated rhomboid family serine protease